MASSSMENGTLSGSLVLFSTGSGPSASYGGTIVGDYAAALSASYNLAAAITSSISTINLSCNGSNNGSAVIELQGNSTPPGTVSTLTYCTSTPGSNNNSTIDHVTLIGDSVDIDNNTTGICDQYEDYSPFQYADITEGQQGRDEGESSLPSVSMIPALISIGLIARYRRK